MAKNKTKEDIKRDLVELMPEDTSSDLITRVATYIDKLKKAFGDCTQCFGKGYGTSMYGEEGFADFDDDKGYKIAPSIRMVFCECERGKQLKELLKERKVHD